MNPHLRDPPGCSIPAIPGFAELNCHDRAAREEILHRAYFIWEKAGRPERRQLADWLQAEREVLGVN
jgi:Protein of unknown function (DUF2934)